MSALSILICFGIPVAVFGGVHFHERFVRFVARKFAEDALSDWTDPDGGLAAAGDLKVSHVQLRTGTEA